jgi:hypothetical protein
MSMASQHGYPLTTIMQQPCRTESPTSDTPGYTYGDAQPIHIRTASIARRRQLQPFDQSAEQEFPSQAHAMSARSRSFLQQIASSAQDAAYLHPANDPEPSAYTGTRNSWTTFDSSTEQYTRAGYEHQTQFASAGTVPQSPHPDLHTLPPAPKSHRAVPPVPQQRILPQPNPTTQPSTTTAPQPLPPPPQPQQHTRLHRAQPHQQQQQQQQQQQRPTQTSSSSSSSPHPAATPIDPRILHEQYLWTQLTSAQLTMVGTLTDLLVRTRSTAAPSTSGPGDVAVGEQQQVRQVTSNLINVMSLWYMLRRERGWDL